MEKEDNSILIDVDGHIMRIIQDNIAFIEASSHFINIHTADEKYMIRKNTVTQRKNWMKRGLLDVIDSTLLD